MKNFGINRSQIQCPSFGFAKTSMPPLGVCDKFDTTPSGDIFNKFDTTPSGDIFNINFKLMNAHLT